METTIGQVERSRIQSHIARAETIAARRALSALSAEQKLVRALLLECLREYREAGIFPDNRDFAEATPYFIDSRGVRCAMAHLLEMGGEFALVQKIARERNNATIAQLADEPRLLEWLDAAGLTVDEAAAIQPGYCDPIVGCICSGGLFGIGTSPPLPQNLLPRVEAVARGTLVMTDAGTFGLQVQQVYGDCSRAEVGATLSVVSLAGAGGPIAVGQSAIIGLRRARNGALLSDNWGFVLGADDTISCGRESPSATSGQIVAASLSEDCVGSMIAFDPRWGGRVGYWCDAGIYGGDASTVSDGGDGWAAGDVPDPSRCMVGPRPDVVLMDATMGADAGTMQMPAASGCACSAMPVAGPPISSIAVLTAVLSALSMRARMRARVRALRQG